MRCGGVSGFGEGRAGVCGGMGPVCGEGRARCVWREGPGVCGGKGPVCVEGRARCMWREGPGVCGGMDPV